MDKEILFLDKDCGVIAHSHNPKLFVDKSYNPSWTRLNFDSLVTLQPLRMKELVTGMLSLMELRATVCVSVLYFKSLHSMQINIV